MYKSNYIWLFATLIISIFTLPAYAQQYRFNYSKLYTQMKNNVEEGHPDVKVAFFFQEHQSTQLCNIEKAWMEKDEHYEELVIPESQELIVPLDNNLRQAGPLVYVNTEKGKVCDFSMVVMTKSPLEGKVSYQEIKQLLPQMTSMLNDLGGMFSSWFAPKVIGLTLEFDDIKQSSIQTTTGNIFMVNKDKVRVTLAELSKGEALLLPQATFRVLPLLEK